MATGGSKPGGKKSKAGRNKTKCERYAREHRRTKNNPARKRREDERTPHKSAPHSTRYQTGGYYY